jgi:Flp pilus assembly protein TadG
MNSQPRSKNRQPADRASRRRRLGMIVVFLVVALPAIIGIVGLVFDAGLLVADSRTLQHAVDAGATAAAMDVLMGEPDEAEATASEYVRQFNHAADANLTVNRPPASGPFSGRNGFVEVITERPFRTRFLHALGAADTNTMRTRAVAGVRDATEGAAIVVLDPEPRAIDIVGLPVTLPLPALPELLGGLEVLGQGTVRVDGAVLVNTAWGGVDQDGNPVGEASGPPYGVSCTPLLGLTRLRARDIRVVGGVDNPAYYTDFEANQPSPLQANRLPSPDPYQELPVPTTGADSANVESTYRGTADVIGVPLVTPPRVLQPGVYDWIQVVSGDVVFQPGVYIIRSVHPVTQIGLNVVGGNVTANGVMFYITDTAGYSATTGGPDGDDLENAPTATPPLSLVPSVVINAALFGSWSPITDSQSPFDGMLLYQRRHDQRPIVVAHQNLLLGGSISGTIYAKWGHVLFVGSATTYDVRLVAGSVRILTVAGSTFAPGNLLPPAQDVYLVE